ncbi:MAG: hypothetical protein U9N76_08615 [Candidatus Marinimicrobia bacterium]|nr:hypothetical protein [Candidatus Neomarinimicrobiota bacterium]
MKKILYILLIVIISTQFTYAKNPVIAIKLKNEPIYNGVYFEKIENDTLFLKIFKAQYPVSINSIEYKKKIKKSKAGAGFLIGGGIGAVLGLTSTKNTSHSGFDGIFYALEVPFAISVAILGGGGVGTLFGTIVGIDEKNDFNKMTIEGKRKVIIEIMDEQKWGINSNKKRRGK